jgi:small subunit ribosomal protein S21
LEKDKRRLPLAEIKLFSGESIEQAMRRFKRQVLSEGIIQEAKKRAFYLKPSESKKLKSKLARIRARKDRRFRNTSR